MKTIPEVSAAIRSEHEVAAVPRLTVEWNYNRYASSVEVDNDPTEDSEGYDIEMFPVESLIEPNRPTAGILKARVGEARIADSYSTHTGKARSARCYLGSVDDIYKYWTSPVQTDGSGIFPTDGTETKVKPHVLYPNGVLTNKIVVGFEDTWAQPDSFEIRVRTTAGGAWTTISTAPPINAKGQVVLYHNGTGWSSVKPDTPQAGVTIYGVKARINSLKGVPGGSPTGANSFASVIEISARRYADLTHRLINVSDNFDMSEKSQVYPVGTITTNTADLVLWNGDGALNGESASSPYKGLLEPNAEFNLEYIYTVNGTEYPVQGFRMFGGAWTGQRGDQVTIQCQDFSKYFQETTPRQSMYENVSATEIVWRLCDSVGFTDYEIQAEDITTDFKISIFWVDGEKTLWEVFDEVAKATQTAIYFDSYGKLQVRTRAAAFNAASAPVWTLRGVEQGTELPDIVTIDQTDELESNNITVTYQTTEFPDATRGMTSQVLWEPEGTVALRAAPLLRTLENGAAEFRLAADEARIWPYEGIVNIQGELIRFKGKEYKYWDNSQYNTATVTSQEEQEKLDAKTAYSNRYKNHYTGRFVITERGVWNSEEKRHPVEAEGYNSRALINGNKDATVDGMIRHDRTASKLVLQTGARLEDAKDILWCTRGATDDTGFEYYGTKFNFIKEEGRKTQIAGILFHNQGGNDEDGYYVEFTPTSKISPAERANKNEVLLYSRKNGVHTRIGPQHGKAIALLPDTEYEVDIYVSPSHYIDVWVNGRRVIAGEVPSAKQNAKNGRFGLFAKGQTEVAFEYLYAIARNENQPEDDFSFLNKVETGYTGGQWDREWVFRWRTERRRVKKKWTKEKYRWNRQFFDEFGPIAHEVREFDVNFDPMPAMHSRIYMGNDYSVICPEYRANAFGAKFYLANTARKTAIVHGEDTLEYAGQTTAVNPVLAVVGRAVVISEAETINVKNESAIRARGNIETEINSPWVQSKESAQAIADWIKDHWSKGADEQSLTIFGNPLLELGDVVALDYPLLDMHEDTHKYFVVAIQNSFEQGVVTQLTLRRVV